MNFHVAHQERDLQIFKEQVNLLYQQTRSETKSNPIPPLIIALFFYDSIGLLFLSFWLITIEIAIFSKTYFLSVFDRYKDREDRWVLNITIANTLHCLIGSFLFLAFDLNQHYAMAVVFSGILLILSSIMAHILASVPNVYILPCLAIHLPVAARCFFTDAPGFTLIGICYLIGAVQFIWLNRNTCKTISESIRLRFENNDLITELEQKKQLAEQANELKTKFLASASHDLRQPLHTMNLFLELLGHETIKPEQRGYLDKVTASSESLTRMLNTLLDISKMDANTIEVRNEHFHLDGVVKTLVEEFMPLAAQKKLTIRTEGLTNAVVFSDRILVERVLRNLIDNAVKYTLRGEVMLAYRKNGEFYTLIVSDTGPGIPESEQQKVFEEFYQLNNPQRDRRLGLGLGLSIVRRLCAILGTEIVLNSAESHGSKWSFNIPCGEVSLIDETPAKIQSLTNALNILVIDDEVDILVGMADLLTTWGNTVETAQTIDNAVVLIQSGTFVPAVLICDYRLRDYKTGLDAIDVIRETLKDAIPAIVLTGDTTPEVVELCKRNRLPLLYKPIKPAKLLSALNNALNSYCESS